MLDACQRAVGGLAAAFCSGPVLAQWPEHRLSFGNQRGDLDFKEIQKKAGGRKQASSLCSPGGLWVCAGVPRKAAGGGASVLHARRWVFVLCTTYTSCVRGRQENARSVDRANRAGEPTQLDRSTGLPDRLGCRALVSGSLQAASAHARPVDRELLAASMVPDKRLRPPEAEASNSGPSRRRRTSTGTSRVQAPPGPLGCPAPRGGASFP